MIFLKMGYWWGSSKKLWGIIKEDTFIIKDFYVNTFFLSYTYYVYQITPYDLMGTPDFSRK